MMTTGGYLLSLTLRLVSTLTGVTLFLGTVPCFADNYPDAITGAWGGRAAYFGDDNPVQAQKACRAYRNPKSNEVGGDVLVFQGSKKQSYGGYADYTDDNVSVKQIGSSKWQIIDRHFDDGEGGKRSGYKNAKYEAQLEGDILIIKEEKYASRFSRCETSPASKSATRADSDRIHA